MEVGCGGAESSKLLIIVWSLWQPASIQKPTESHLVGTKDIPITQEIPRALRALCKEPGSKPNIRTKDAPRALII